MAITKRLPLFSSSRQLKMPERFLGAPLRTSPLRAVGTDAASSQEDVERFAKAAATFDLDALIAGYYTTKKVVEKQETKRLREANKITIGPRPIDTPKLTKKAINDTATAHLKKSNCLRDKIKNAALDGLAFVMAIDSANEQLEQLVGSKDVLTSESMRAVVANVYHLKFLLMAAEESGMPEHVTRLILEHSVQRRFGMSGQPPVSRDSVMASALANKLETSSRAIQGMARQVEGLDGRVGALYTAFRNDKRTT